MMTCQELIDLLIDFIDGELPPERVHYVEEHLRICRHCVTYVQTYRITIQLTRKLPCAAPPPRLLQRLQAALEALREEGR
ncbi:MAG: anti-sigma factor family protein [Gemmataceae bacterium]